METEIGVMRPEAEDGQQSPEAGRGQEQTLPSSFWKEHSAAGTFISES